MSDHNIRRSEFPSGPHQVQGMAAQASTWLLIQMDKNDMTTYEALYIANAMLDTVVRIIGREEQRLEKRRAASRARRAALRSVEHQG